MDTQTHRYTNTHTHTNTGVTERNSPWWLQVAAGSSASCSHSCSENKQIISSKFPFGCSSPCLCLALREPPHPPISAQCPPERADRGAGATQGTRRPLCELQCSSHLALQEIRDKGRVSEASSSVQENPCRR